MQDRFAGLRDNTAVQSYPNTTTASSSIFSPAVTPSPISTTTNGTNSTCADCALFLGPQILQQVVWFTDTIGLTLDTVSVQITQYPGNATAVTNTITEHGDLRTVNASTVSAALAISSSNLRYAVAQYMGGGSMFLASGTDGNIDEVTSLVWPTPYVRVSSIVSYTTIYDSYCPSRTYGTGPCGCALRTSVDPQTAYEGVTSGLVPMSANFYYPILPSRFNLSMLESNRVDEFAYMNVSSFSSWLIGQPWATAAIPNLDRCIFAGAPQGPPAIKIPVSALTASVTTTIQGTLPPKSPVPQPASQVTSPMASQTTQPSPDHVPSTPYPSGTAGSGNTASNEGGGGPSNPPNVASTATGPNQGGGGPSNSPNVASTPTQSMHAPNPPNVASNPIQQMSPPNPSHSVAGTSDQAGGNVAPVVQSSTAGEAAPASPKAVVTGSGGGNAYISSQPANQPNQVTAVTPIATLGSEVVSVIPTNSAIVVAGSTLTYGQPALAVSGVTVSVGQAGIVIGSNTLSLPPAAPATVFSAGGHTITSSAGAVLVAGQTINSGAPAIIIPGATVSLGSSGLAIGTSTIALPTLAGSPSALTVAGQTFTAVPSGVVISGSTLLPGAPAITMSGTPVVLGSSGLVVGTSTIALPTPTPSASAFTVAGQTFAAVPGGVVIAGSTLLAGGPAATISGTRVSVGTSNIIVGSSTATISNAIAASTAFTVGGQTFTAYPSGVPIAGTTLQAGGPPITISGTAISLGSSGLIIGSSTIPLPTPAPSSTTFVLGSQTYTANPTAIAISGTILTLGSPAATISSTPISLGASGLVIGTSTYPLPSSLPSSVMVTDGQTFTVHPTAIEIAGTTLSEGGPAVTVGGTPISLGTAGLVVGSSTVSYRNGPLTATSGGLGGAIIAGFGPSTATPTATSSPQAFVGGVGRSAVRPSVLVLLGWLGMWSVGVGGLVGIRI